jgi:hypothetical protein
VVIPPVCSSAFRVILFQIDLAFVEYQDSFKGSRSAIDSVRLSALLRMWRTSDVSTDDSLWIAWFRFLSGTFALLKSRQVILGTWTGVR